MKKLLLTSAILSLSFCCLAQGFSGGIKAGLNLADQKYSLDGTTVDTKMKSGLNAGVFFVASINDKFAIQPELLFSMEGCKMTLPDLDYDYVISFNYLSIPILARYNITDRISIHAGPQLAFLMSANSELSNGTQVMNVDIKEYYKTMELSGAIGGEIDIIAGLGAGARYVFGLTKIHKDDIDNDGKVKNNVIQIYLKYRLFGGK